MKTTHEDWQKKLTNLHTRTKGISSEHQIDYKRLLKNVHIGQKVLDVGCGTMWLADYIPDTCYYHGIDAYIEESPRGFGFNQVSIEECVGGGEYYNTLFVFAALDGMRDLFTAFQAMKELAFENIVILTGINIEPDLYHTHLITLDFIKEQMDGFKLTYEEFVHPKIVFLEFTKNK